MKLLFYVENFSMAGSGAENDAVHLCMALAERGHHVHVCCDTGEAYGDIVVHKGLSNVAGIIAKVQPERTVDWGLFHPADIFRLGGGLHEPYLKYYARAFPGWMRVFKHISFKFSRKHRGRIELERRLLRHSDSVYLAISNFVAEQAISFGLPAERVKVVYNGVDVKRFCPGSVETRARVRKTWKVNDDEKVFLFIAHNLRLKNMALLIRVFDDVYKTDKKIKLAVCGKRVPKDVRPYLIHVGTTATIEEFYQASDALLHPSFYDSFANVVLEAMSCGLPVAVSNCSGVRDLIHDGEDGFILPVTTGKDSDSDWQGVVKQLAADTEKLNRVGEMARKTAEKHDFPTYVDAFDAALKLAGAHGTA